MNPVFRSATTFCGVEARQRMTPAPAWASRRAVSETIQSAIGWEASEICR